MIDLKEGEAWWVTRLLALSAGAVRAGSPTAFVFIGTKENLRHQFLGWAEPKRVLDSILRSNAEYGRRYIRAMRIAQQVFMYGNHEFLPQQPGPFVLHSDVQRYLNEEFAGLGSAVAEQILMDQLALSFPGPSLETPPDRLTLSRLNDLFGHCLNTKTIDLNWSKETQVAKARVGHLLCRPGERREVQQHDWETGWGAGAPWRALDAIYETVRGAYRQTCYLALTGTFSLA